MQPPLFLGILLILMIGVAIVSLMLGVASIEISEIWGAFMHYDSDNMKHYMVRDVRLPRALTAILVGMSFAVSGAIMQGLTRNPLASPSIMGVSAGSGFAIVLVFAFVPYLAYHQIIVVSMIGAAVATLLVFSIGVMASRWGMGANLNHHVKLAIAGSTIGALLGAFSDGIEIYYGLAHSVMQWYASGISGVKWMDVRVIFPWTLGGLMIAWFIANRLSLLALGEETAVGLGQRVRMTKLFGALAVFALTGSAVAVAGSISFIGLLAPHLVRFVVGVHYRWIIPCSAVLGGGMLLLADVLSRLVNMPRETPAGIITALIGVPFFLYLARKEGRGQL